MELSESFDSEGFSDSSSYVTSEFAVTIDEESVACRGYKHFDPELKAHNFKKEYLRQGLLRALQYLLKHLFSPASSKPKSPIARFILSRSEAVRSFRNTAEHYRAMLRQVVFPRTLSGRRSQYQGRSVNDDAWVKILKTDGIRPLLRVMLNSLFETQSPQTLCGIWRKQCCKGPTHSAKCEGMWSVLRTFLEEECQVQEVFDPDDLLALPTRFLIDS